MNKSVTPRNDRSWLIFFLIIFSLWPSGSQAFKSSDEFTDHIKGKQSCLAGECHKETITEKNKYQHKPALNDECTECHKAELYPNEHGLETNQRQLCARCHNVIERQVQASQFVHKPIKNNDCTSCHDPHETNEPYLLKESYPELCSSCHATKKLFTGSFVHKPVKDGNCGLCHDPHASNNIARLTDIGANLCLSCHEDIILDMAGKHIHAPLLDKGCTDCHDPHYGDNKLRLIRSEDQLCFNCHEDKKNEVELYTHKHIPAKDGQCTSCHSPHYSEFPKLIKDHLGKVCNKCHEESRQWEKRKFLHGPVLQGNCSACHNPHGSENPFILRLSFPHKFYTSYEKGKYNLCFNCHKQSMLSSEKSITATNFRNGDRNLHWFHVNQKKGRSCRACHDVHASDQEGRIRDEFPFGKVMIPMYYSKSETGGTCIPGCHRERAYDRLNKVINKN